MERKPVTFRRDNGRYTIRELVRLTGSEAQYKVTEYPTRRAWRQEIRRRKAQGKS